MARGGSTARGPSRPGHSAHATGWLCFCFTTGFVVILLLLALLGFLWFYFGFFLLVLILEANKDIDMR